MAKPAPTDSRTITARERSIVTRWAALAVILLITAGGFAIAYLHASAAGDRAQATANCVNGILASRAPATESDSQAQRQFIDETARLTRSLFVAVSAPVDQQATKFALFVVEVRQFNAVADHVHAVLAASQAYRNAHPLGRC